MVVKKVSIKEFPFTSDGTETQKEIHNLHVFDENKIKNFAIEMQKLYMCISEFSLR